MHFTTIYIKTEWKGILVVSVTEESTCCCRTPYNSR